MKLDAMAVNTAIAAGARHRATPKPTGMRQRPRAKQKAGNVSSAGSTANLIVAAQMMLPVTPIVTASAPAGARSPLGDSSSSTIAAMTMANAPSGHAVATQISSTAPIATNARAALTREGSQSGTAWPETAMVRRKLIRSIDEQREPVEHAQHAGQHFGGLVGEQPQRWGAGRQGKQRPHRLLANAAQGHRISHPACRRAWLSRRSQLGRNAAQDNFCLLPSHVLRQTAQMRRHSAPTIQRHEQAVDGCLQRERVVADVARLLRALGRSSGRAR